MSATTTTALVWTEINRRFFAVLSYVTPRAEARSAGVVYVVRDGRFYIRADTDSWKARHIRLNPSVALNVTIPKRVPFMPWIRIPEATIAFRGTARVIDGDAAQADLVQALARATSHDAETLSGICFIEVTPAGHFATYGVGVSLLDMRKPVKARARVAVA
jgi:nitroimidazol reductase NimA-like FMN-containing flavoprotein (pyridoxamine 5'-phosphate oxidase superfamily)